MNVRRKASLGETEVENGDAISFPKENSFFQLVRADRCEGSLKAFILGLVWVLVSF